MRISDWSSDVCSSDLLVVLGAFPIDAEDADMPGMVMPAGVDAARDLDLQLAQILLPLEIGEALGDLLRDGDRARVGAAAIIVSGAGVDVGDAIEIDIRRPRFHEGLPHRIQNGMFGRAPWRE